jgi:DNA-binding CsgD family transcriptional regulator
MTLLLGRRTEREALDRLLADVRAGQSRVLVLRGDPGVGKTALLHYLAEQASDYRIVQVAGVESEMELAYAGLHNVYATLLDRLDALPSPQRDALATAFGLTAGEPPNQFLVGLAALGLLADAAEDEPVICLVDDAQWLDRVSVETIAFMARRLLAESVGVVFAVREPCHEGLLAGLPELVVTGLSDEDSRELLGSVIRGPVDARVLERIVAETHGNPLALLELPHGLTPGELAAGFGLPEPMPVAGRIEAGFVRRLEQLPAESRRLLLIAAADPLGDAALLWRALERLGVDPDAALLAAEAALIDVDGGAVRFRHPLVRSASYRSATPRERQAVHRALAEATDPEVDPDHRAWHRAQATSGPDEDVARELERSAGRAQARGGLSAAAAFIERAAMVTPEPALRARRALAAAAAKRHAGALDVALGLLVVVDSSPPDELRGAEAQRLRGQIARDQQRDRDAVPLLLSAARRLAPLDARMARDAYLEAIAAAWWVGDLDGPDGLREAARAARSAPPAPGAPEPADLVLDALAVRYAGGHEAAAPLMRAALEALVAAGVDDWLWVADIRVAGVLALEVWDWDLRHALAARQVEHARERGALVQLQFALDYLAASHLVAGDLAAAARLAEEDHLIAEATGARRTLIAMAVEAFRGNEYQASRLIDATAREGQARGIQPLTTLASYSRAVLNNGLGRHDAARDAARYAFDHDTVGYRAFYGIELAEAASRTGDLGLVSEVDRFLAERVPVTPTDWALGIAARVRALLARGEVAEREFRESIARLDRTRVRVELARGHLLYGEWLRREGRRVDARNQLRIAHAMLGAMGLDGFAERARRELRATGERAPKRTAETRDDLTPQEAEIARLAAEGLTNPEIGARMFLSRRTVEWHLKKVFLKLDVTSRRQLEAALSDVPRVATTA